jgi:TRAP-type C4-dicarboxylate transport system permease small subunit
MNGLAKFIAGSDRLGRALETGLLVLILGSMILLAFAQIVLRNFADIGFLWGDELLRMLVLWVALAGAVAASRSDKHINIAVLDRFLPPRLKSLVQLLAHLFTAAICAVVAWFSFQFVLTSKEYEDLILGDVPAWILQSILPIGFGLISWRYSLFVITDFIHLVTGKQATETPGSKPSGHGSLR